MVEDCARRIVLLELTTDRHQASRDLSATAELLIERCLRQASKSIFGLTWPWPLTSGPQSLSFYAFTPWATCCNWHQNRFIWFSKYRVHTFGNRQTDGQTNKQTDTLRRLCYRLRVWPDRGWFSANWNRANWFNPFTMQRLLKCHIEWYEVGTLAVDGWAVTFCIARRDWAGPQPALAVPNVTAHPSTAIVPITVLLYNGPLLCGLMCR